MTLATMSPEISSGSVQSAGVLTRLRNGVHRRVCMLDARLRTVAAEPEKGAVTAEYAVVIVAAAAFAVVLLTIVKSDQIKQLLLKLIQNALKVG